MFRFPRQRSYGFKEKPQFSTVMRYKQKRERNFLTDSKNYHLHDACSRLQLNFMSKIPKSFSLENLVNGSRGLKRHLFYFTEISSTLQSLIEQGDLET